ncbi:MAG: DUF2961 domain-containing protein [Verrucomicrobia bacterium]|nr:DUF2961 domain-containing protein [Verrucomicrobiota bacterium]
MSCLSRILIPLTALLPLTSLHAQQNLDSAFPDLATLKNYRTMRASSSDPNWRNGNGDARPIPPGGTLTLAEVSGPGEIAHIWFTISDRERGYPRLLTLRMYWDGEKTPSVECPVGDFFGIGHGMDVPFDSLPVRVSSNGKGRNCYWPMPFRKSARITVTNEGRERCNAFYYYIDWRKLPRLGRDTAYFHAMYRQEFPAVAGRNYLIADIAGRGHYVGTVMNCRQLTPSWWGEGDDFFFIDGEKEPSLRGTGTEDYFCDGWGFRQQAGAYYGAPLVEGSDTGHRTSVYRWHIPDPVVFKKSLRLEIEHKGVAVRPDGTKSGFDERADDLSSVAFWYQTEPHKPFEPMPAGYARLYHDYTRIIEGESLLPGAKATEGNLRTQKIGSASGGEHLWWQPTKAGQEMTLSFDVKEPGNYELILLLTHAADYGTYQVELDGKPIGSKPQDLYGTGIIVQEHVFAPQKIEAGRHTLTFKGRGKNGASKGYYFGLDGLLLSKR